MTETHVRQIQRQGFCVIPGVIPPDRIAPLRDEMVRVVTGDNLYRSGLTGVAIKENLINVTQAFALFLRSTPLISVIEALLGPHVRVNSASVIVTQSGNARGDWHVDWPFGQFTPGHMPAPYPDLVMHLSTIWMLTPFTTKTGGTSVVPGSHRWGDNPRMDKADLFKPYPGEVQAEGEAGSVLVFDTRLWHAVAPNVSGEPRVALAVRYMPWWLNIHPQIAGSRERRRFTGKSSGDDGGFQRVKKEIFEALPDDLRALFVNNVEQDV